MNLTACSNKGSDNTAEPEKPAEMTELQEPVETQAEKEARENLEKARLTGMVPVQMVLTWIRLKN